MATGHRPFFLTLYWHMLCINGYTLAIPPISLPLQECIIKTSRERPRIIIKHLVRLYNLYNRYFIWYIGLLIEFFYNVIHMALSPTGPHFARVLLGKERSYLGGFTKKLLGFSTRIRIFYILCGIISVDLRINVKK
eukprot:UN12813